MPAGMANADAAETPPSYLPPGLFRAFTTSRVSGGFGFAAFSDGPQTATSSQFVEVRRKPSRFDKLVLKQANPARRVWELLLALVLIYVATLLPFKLTFLEGAVHGVCTDEGVCTADNREIEIEEWQHLDEYFMEPFFILDIMMNFIFSYQDANGKEVAELFPCVKHYVTSSFCVDFIAGMPSRVISAAVNFMAGVDPSDVEGDNSGNNMAKVAKYKALQRATKLTRLVRLARLLKIVAFLKNNETFIQLKEMRAVRMMNFLFFLLWSVHLFACAWYYVAAMHDNRMHTWLGQRALYDGTLLIEIPDPALAWLHSMYFIMTTFTTVGFGDMSAKTVGEMVFVMLLMIAGIFVNSIILSSAIDIWHNVDETAQQIDDQKKVVEGFGEHTYLSSQRILDLKEYAGQKSVGTTYDREKMKELLTSAALPRDMIKQLPKEIFQGKLEKNKFITCCNTVFRIVPPRFSLLVGLWCNLRYYLKHEICYYCHDHAANIYLVHEGIFAYLAIATSNGGRSSIPPAGLNAVQALVRKGSRANAAEVTTGNSEKMVPTQSMVARGETSTSLSPYKLFGPCNYFGDAEVLLEPGPRRACARCESKSGRVLVLGKNEITDMLQEFPSCSDAWSIASRRRDKHDKSMLARLTTAPCARAADEFRPAGWQQYEDLAASIIGRWARERLKPRDQQEGRYALSHSERQAIQARKSVQRSCAEIIPQCVRSMASSVQGMRAELTDTQARMKADLSGLAASMRELHEDIARLAEASQDNSMQRGLLNL